MNRVTLLLSCLTFASTYLYGQDVQRPFLTDSIASAQFPLRTPVGCQRQIPSMGQVLLEFVIDTLGHVEPGSIVVMRASDSTLVPLAKQILITCRYVPGRINGHFVRSGVGRFVTF